MRDNVFVERIWKSIKYEEVYLRAYDSAGDARASSVPEASAGLAWIPRKRATEGEVNRWPSLSKGRSKRFWLRAVE